MRANKNDPNDARMKAAHEVLSRHAEYPGLSHRTPWLEQQPYRPVRFSKILLQNAIPRTHGANRASLHR
jgi:hypothetical protein